MRAALGLPILLLLLISCSRIVVNTPALEQPLQDGDSLEQQFEQDNLGLLYRAIAADDRLRLTELITKQGPSGQLLIRWTLLNAESQYPVDEVYVNVTILDKSLQVTENWTTRASANVSDDLFYLDLQSKTNVTHAGGYVLEWRGLPER
jgi:hypothetical protein